MTEIEKMCIGCHKRITRDQEVYRIKHGLYGNRGFEPSKFSSDFYICVPCLLAVNAGDMSNIERCKLE